MLKRCGAVLLEFLCHSAMVVAEPQPIKPVPQPVTIDRICTLIAKEADANGLPRDFFARLIWKESRFDHNAVSPVGAEGIAQFMPGTAKIVGLNDPFDIDQAIPASAAYLAKLKSGFGNWGLAAAAYNGGETRVANWLSSGGLLPLETENYVLDITGKYVDHFSTRANEIEPRPLDKKLTFEEACRKLPVIAASTVAMSRVKRKPWGIQVAGNFRQSAALKQWEREKRAHPGVLGKYRAVVSRVRTPIGRRSIFAVRIGADSRGEADRVCAALRSSGGACIVTKNR
jgi:hypothetical protein